MPDEPIVAPAAAETAPETPPSKGGTASLMSEMDSMMGGGEPAKEPEKPAEPKEPKASEKPAPAKPATPPKDESGKFVAKAEPAKEKDPVQLRKRLAEVESDLTKTRAEKESTVGELQRKMAELEKRPFLTKEQQEKYNALEDRSKQLEAQLYARSYSESPEYKEKYQKRWQARYESAVREVGRLQVKRTDENGEESTRLATQADFERVRALRGSEAAQLDEAESIFGNRASLVVKYCNELDSIEQQAQEDVATRRAKYDEEMAQRGHQSQKFVETVQQAASATESQLAEKYPEWFGKSDDPEIEAAMKKGLGFVDSTSAEADKLDPAERGSRVATIRLLAGAFPRNALRIKRLEKQLEDANAKVSKLQGTDPGEGGDGGAAEKKSDGPVGTAGLAAEFA